MKHALLVVLLLAWAVPGLTQVASGSKFINGTVHLSIISNSGNAQTSVTFSPTFGYFINDRTAVGGTLGVIRQFTENDTNSLTVFLSPFVRRYFSIVDDTFYFFVDGSLAFSYGNSAAGFGEFRSSQDALSVSLTASPGFAYFPAEQWGLDFTFTGLGLSFFNIGNDGGTTTLFSLGATTFSPSLGFSYYF